MAPAKQSNGEQIDEVNAGSFPASDPPSWTLGASSVTPTPPPGTLSSPAPRAALSTPDFGPAIAVAEGPTPAELFARRPPPADTTLLVAGGAAAAAGVLFTLRGSDRWGRALGQGGIALMLAGLFHRFGKLAASGTGADRSVH